MSRLILLALLSILTISSARAQLAANYADCAALDGTTFTVDGLAVGVVVNTTVIASLLDTDLVNIQANAAGTVGIANITVDFDGVTAMTAVLTPGGSSSGMFDPTADGANVNLRFTNQFTGNPGIEMSVSYTITCTANAGAAVVSSFLNERNRRILDYRPDRPRLVRKRLDSLWGDASGDTEDVDGNLTPNNFWTDGRLLRAHFDLGELAINQSADGRSALTSGYGAQDQNAQSRGCWDAWTEAHYMRFYDSGNRRGNFLIGYAGIDCQVHPAVMLGFLGQVDWIDDKIGSLSAEIDGLGWMVGPYATARLTPDLYLDMRAAWGRSDNDINISGMTGSFDTSRWLIDGQLTGNVNMGDVRITPEISLSYIEERQNDFLDSSNNYTASQVVSLGRLRFGPEVSKRYILDSGLTVEPHFSLGGIWDFAGTNVKVAGVDYNIEGLRGVAELGFILQRSDDFNVRVSVKYDGIGLKDYHAFGGQFWLNIPLN